MDTFAEMNAKIGKFDFKLAWNRILILRAFRPEESRFAIVRMYVRQQEMKQLAK